MACLCRIPAFDDPNQQDQLTIGNGYYKFDINFSSPACPGPGNYLVQVTAPSTAYVPGVSQFIPPTSDLNTLPFDVPACPGSGIDAASRHAGPLRSHPL